MSTLHPSFSPGAKKQYTRRIIQYVQAHPNDNNCSCPTDVPLKYKPGVSWTYQSEQMRIGSLLSSGYTTGRIQYGNSGDAPLIQRLGGREGQPGGIPPILKNRF